MFRVYFCCLLNKRAFVHWKLMNSENDEGGLLSGKFQTLLMLMEVFRMNSHFFSFIFIINRMILFFLPFEKFNFRNLNIYNRNVNINQWKIDFLTGKWTFFFPLQRFSVKLIFRIEDSIHFVKASKKFLRNVLYTIQMISVIQLFFIDCKFLSNSTVDVISKMITSV